MEPNRCKDCKHWKELPSEKPYEKRGTCKSELFQKDCRPVSPMPPSYFGCVYWQEKEPDFRYLLAEHLFILCRGPIPDPNLRFGWEGLSEVKRKQMYAEADYIIALVKGEADATSS